MDFNYLLESGINKSLLYYVFNELNLRLPDSFDMSDIATYTPQTFIRYAALPLQHNGQVSTSLESLAKPSLSSRLTTPPPISDAVALIDRVTVSNLSDMERSRRQELLARKAVQASRKQSRPDARHNSPPVRTTDVPGSRVEKQSDATISTDNDNPIARIPSDSVDDFLNSLGPVHDLNSSFNRIPFKSMVTSENHDGMDVDQTVEYGEAENTLEELTSSDRSFSEPPPPSTEPPPTSVSSVSTTFSTVPTAAPASKSSIFLPAPIPARRATKRPVASDFVDFDSSTRKQDAERPPSRSNGHGQPTVIPRRSLTTSFHNVGALRRCVIDLSDSEDDDVLYPADQQPNPHYSEDITRQRRELNRQGKPGVHATPTPFKPSDTIPPDVLAEKESQIRKMRELIAKREEETRLRKLAVRLVRSLHRTSF